MLAVDIVGKLRLYLLPVGLIMCGSAGQDHMDKDSLAATRAPVTLFVVLCFCHCGEKDVTELALW